MNEPTLPDRPSLQEFQKYVAQIIEARGFDGSNVTGQFMQLTEEVGELAKAIRKSQKMSIDPTSKVGAIDEELADIFIYLLYFCNYFQVDLEKAFRDKEAINKQRVWKKEK
jgi:NTP pyrophosphatase (non-canonical NTP hydrolase)